MAVVRLPQSNISPLFGLTWLRCSTRLISKSSTQVWTWRKIWMNSMLTPKRIDCDLYMGMSLCNSVLVPAYWDGFNSKYFLVILLFWQWRFWFSFCYVSRYNQSWKLDFNLCGRELSTPSPGVFHARYVDELSFILLLLLSFWRSRYAVPPSSLRVSEPDGLRKSSCSLPTNRFYHTNRLYGIRPYMSWL